jgi:predicted ATP-grasp superfamily ATP-dependent carboligase
MNGVLDSRWPPCVVLGLETQIGLCVVRELGRAGVSVIGIAQEEDAIGLCSRYLTTGMVVGEARSEALLQAIRAIGERFGPCPLLAISEANLDWLSRHRESLGQVTPVVPEAAALRIVLDKQSTLDVARAVGIDTPVSIQPQPGWQMDDLVSRCRLPVVLKWSDPNAVVRELESHGLPLLKAEYVHTRADLQVALSRYSAIGQWPLVQEYCAGYGLGQFFFMHQGQALRRFQHRRVAEWPPEGGFSSVCDAVPLTEHVDLQERSIALLRAIGWEGVAMVEYRYDPLRCAARLMEINGRFWGSFPLAYHAGAGFALLCYRQAAGLPLAELDVAPRSDLRCRMVATELKRLSRIVLRPGLIADPCFRIRPWQEVWRFAQDFFRPTVRYYVWSLNDPRPFFADLRNLLRNA